MDEWDNYVVLLFYVFFLLWGVFKRVMETGEKIWAGNMVTGDSYIFDFQK